MNEALLPDDFELLKAIIRDRESHIEFLEERLRLLQNELFRRSSEKRPVQEDPRQLHLFNEAEVAAQEAPVKEQIAGS